MEWKTRWKPLGRWMQSVERSGPESQPTAPGNKLIVADKAPIAVGSKRIASRSPLANSEYLGQGRRRGQLKINQPMGIYMNEIKTTKKKVISTHE